MPSESEITDLLALISDTREHLTYLKELGVERANPSSQVAPPQPASSQQVAPKLPSSSFSTQPTSHAAAAAAARVSAEKPVLDSLFGDLSAEPARLQKSSETLEEIWADVGDCTRCPLYQKRTNIVHTEGNRNARLMFVGEAPGADEDAQARPFVGRAGQLLTKIIEAIGLKREEVLIGNVNRCRPPGNRPPTPEEASMCKPFLLREIAAVQPEVIVVLGNTAMKNLLDIKQGITRVRGEFQNYHGVKVMPTFHPAYLLRDPSKKKETWEDLKKVRDFLDAARKPEN